MQERSKMGIEYVKETYQMQLKPLLMRAVLYFGDKEGIYSRDHHDKDFRCTWRELYGRLRRLANALEKLGVEQGDKIGRCGISPLQSQAYSRAPDSLR